MLWFQFFRIRSYTGFIYYVMCYLFCAELSGAKFLQKTKTLIRVIPSRLTKHCFTDGFFVRDRVRRNYLYNIVPRYQYDKTCDGVEGGRDI